MTDATATTAIAPPGANQTISPALRKKLQQCYEHGTRLLQQGKHDFDYAHSILIECVVNDPGNAVYVEAFLQNLQRKYNNNKRGSLLAFGGKGPFKKALTRKDWAEALKLGPDLLKSNPWDVFVLRGLADACAACGFSDVELRYLKNALDANPKDPEVNRHCAMSLARIGQFDQAIACWQRVDEAKRGDLEAQRMISELQIAKTQAKGGFGKTEPARRTASPTGPARAEVPASPVAKSPAASPASAPETSTAPPAKREIRLTPRQQLEQALLNNPTDLDSYLQLAQIHIDDERLGEATHVLTRALAASGNHYKVQERLEDVEILRKKQQLAVAERRSESTPNPANQELVHHLREDLNRMELEVFDRRSQRYPNDRELKYQLGLRLKRAGNIREAIAQFESSLPLPGREAAIAMEIGECLQRLKQYEKALKQYWAAAEGSSSEQLEQKKLALYRIGVLAEGLRHLEDAERSLEQLVELDPNYRDASPRLDKIRGMRHKHT